MRGTALGLLAALTALSFVLFSPAAGASPESDAHDAITAAWEAAGGNESRLGAPQGDVYPVGAGFAADYTGGKIFFTPGTGAHAMYGPILDEYESLGGPASSDLGFPNINQTPGLAGPESQFIAFSAVDGPLIFFTPEHGAFVVRGAINAAWDALKSSAGPLGPPAGDETFAGDLITQTFASGELSWNRKTNAYTTVPPELAGQLVDLRYEENPIAAINAAWRATGGATGPLGVRQGEPQPIGDDGQVQEFAGGKVFYTPTTGANAVDGQILQKYESLGGPLGSDLGFPISNPTDAGLGPDSQVSAFAAADQPVIFWSSEHGAFVVRGAMRAAWDKLGGAGGDLGAPVGDQTVDGDLVQQQFADGTISWNQAENSFTTEPEKLAGALSGLQIPGAGEATAPTTGPGTASSWHWWWLPVSIGVLLLAGLLAWAARWWQRRRSDVGAQPRAREPVRAAVGRPAEEEPSRWAPEIDDDEGPPYGESFYELSEPTTPEPPPGEIDDSGLPSRVAWAHRAGEEPTTTGFGFDEIHRDDYYGDRGDEGVHRDVYEDVHESLHEGFADLDEENSDDVDTGPIRLTDEPPPPGRHSVTEEYREGYRYPGSYDDEYDARHEVSDEPPPWRGTLGEPEPEHPAAHPAMHLPLSDPYQPPPGYPIKANTISGLYYTPENALYHDTMAEIWFATEEVARANGFVRAE